MFESLSGGGLPSPGACGTAELVVLMAARGRAEAAHEQRKLAVTAELDRRRSAVDELRGVVSSATGEFVVAEVGVGLTVGQGMANLCVHIGVQLRDRLPPTKQAFARGELDFPRVRIIVDRTDHLDDDVLAGVGAADPGHSVGCWSRVDRRPPAQRDRPVGHHRRPRRRHATPVAGGEGP